LRVVHQVKPPELAHVAKAKGRAGCQVENHANMTLVFRHPRTCRTGLLVEKQAARHTQVHKQVLGRAQRHDDELASTRYLYDLASHQVRAKSVRLGRGYRAGPSQLHIHDVLPNQVGAQASRDGLNFG
jgi:hypothetical protein